MVIFSTIQVVFFDRCAQGIPIEFSSVGYNLVLVQCLGILLSPSHQISNHPAMVVDRNICRPTVDPPRSKPTRLIIVELLLFFFNTSSLALTTSEISSSNQ